jgi:magnesium transporter
MNTEYLSLPADATVASAMEAVRAMDYVPETLSTLFLLDVEERLQATVPIAHLFLHAGETPLLDLASDTKIEVPVDESQERVVELFDKYNLLTLPVIGKDGRLAGVIAVDDVVAVLRQK